MHKKDKETDVGFIIAGCLIGIILGACCGGLIYLATFHFVPSALVGIVVFVIILYYGLKT